jgi:hypothetical protein
MCSPTHNAAPITTSYPPANLPPSEPTDRHQVPSHQSNRTRDPMQIKSLATCLKRYVTFFFLSPGFTLRKRGTVCITQRHLTPIPPPLSFTIASTARGPAASPVVGLVRRGMRCRSRVYHRQRARPRRWCIYGQSTWGHSGCKGQERGRRVLRVGRATESRGTRRIRFLGARARFVL